MKLNQIIWKSCLITSALAVCVGATVQEPTPAAPAAPPAPAATPSPAPAAATRAEARAEASAARATARAQEAQARAAAKAPRAQVYMFGQGSYLGVDVQDVTADRMKALKLSEERGAEVTLVDQDGPAGKAGLKEGDVVLSFNGQRVEGREQLQRMIHETPSGRKVALGISRDGKAQTINAELADRRELASSKWTVSPRIVVPPVPPIMIPPIHIEPFNSDSVRIYNVSTPRLGMSVEPLTQQLGDYFGAPNGQGLLVRSVEKGSPADSAGLKAGDVITKFGGERVSDSGDWRSALREHTGSVPVTVLREKHEQTLTLKTPEHQRGSVGMGWGGGAGAGWGDFDFDFDFDVEVKPQIDLAMKQAAASMKDAQKQIDKAMKDWQKDWDKQYKDDSKDNKDEEKQVTKPKPIKYKAKDKSATTA